MTRTLLLAVALGFSAAVAFAGGSAEAPLGSEEHPIIWAFVPSGDTQSLLAGTDRVIRMMEERTGFRFEAVVAQDYSGVLEALAGDPPEAHMAAMNPLGAVVAAEQGIAEPALVSLRNGQPYYRGQIIAGADSGVSATADLVGKTFARVDPASVSGWVIPRIVLTAAGIDPQNGIELLDAGSHPQVVAAVYSQTAEAGATYVDAREAVMDELPDVMERVVVVEEFGPIPNDGIQFSTKMEPETRETIVEALLDIVATEEGAEAIGAIYDWNELVRQGDDFYDSFREIVEAGGLNPRDLVDSQSP